MKITLFYNPKAGGNGLPIKTLVKSLKKRGAEVVIQNTKKEGFSKALGHDADFIIIAGGDGTIEKIVRLFVHKKTPIAILPFGNANNIANSLDVENTLDTIFKRWESREFSKFSVGSILLNREEMYFFESVGWGMFAVVLSEIKKNKKKGKNKSSDNNKKVQSGMKKLLKSVKDLRPFFYGIILDGVDYSDDYLWVEIMNTQSMGPLLQMAPDAKHDDEYLDVVLVKSGEEDKLEQFLKAQQNGGEVQYFQTLKAKIIRVNSQETIHLDDEIIQPDHSGDDWVEVKLLPHYIEIINA